MPLPPVPMLLPLATMLLGLLGPVLPLLIQILLGIPMQPYHYQALSHHYPSQGGLPLPTELPQQTPPSTDHSQTGPRNLTGHDLLSLVFPSGLLIQFFLLSQ